MFEQESHCSVKQLEYIAVNALAVYEFHLVSSSETRQAQQALGIVCRHFPVGKQDGGCMVQYAVPHQAEFFKNDRNVVSRIFRQASAVYSQTDSFKHLVLINVI